jgi:hypothetical protein
LNGRRHVDAASQVSPTRKNGEPSAYTSAWPLGLARTKPRRFGFADRSASGQATARTAPAPPFNPASSAGVAETFQRHSPGAVATNRTLNVRPPSQKP